MMDFSQMYAHFAVAIVLGALMGLERELAGKEAGIRTGMMVSGGAAIFSIIALELPALIADSSAVGHVNAIVVGNAGFLNIIANIAVGIGFLGAGIIIKTEEHVHGLTSAAVIWVIAAVGTLAGIGLTKFAVATAITVSVLLYAMRKLGVAEMIQSSKKKR